MSNNSLVSVIIIFLNAEEFIAEAIESVFSQTYSNWQLLLVDDGSTDNSTEIALGYARDYRERVRYLEHDGHQNRGMSASRNLGITTARGEFIAFLDADDVWLPSKLEEQVAILVSQPEAAMVYGAIQWWYSWTGKAEDAHRDFIPELQVRPDTLMKPPELLAPFLRNETVTATNGLIRRGVIKSLGGYEEAFRGMYEDQVVYTKICLNTPVFVANKCWYRWRRHPRSACAVALGTGEYASSRLIFLRWLRNYLSQQGIEDDEIRRALNEEILKCRNPALFSLLRNTRHRMEDLKEHLKSLVRRTLPRPVYRWLRVRRHGENYRPAVGEVNFGSLRRMTPISRIFGFDRGQPIDRYYIEGFLERNAADVKGRVLEVGDDTYTRRFGESRVTKADVLHVSEGHPQATIVADLSRAGHISSDTFDCIILTQTLHLIYDVRAAMSTLHRILRPGGVLLATFPGISQIDHYDWGGSWYWAFTALSARRLFEEAFLAPDLKIETHGNVLTAVAFLQGLATEELRKEELDYNDPDYEVTITVRAVKGADS